MSKILELYAELNESKQRFIDEIFGAEIYRKALPQLTIIDAGAYEGEFSFYCLNIAKKIYAFEPDPTPFKSLNARVLKYELGDIIKVSPLALAAKKGKRVFHASGFGGSRLLGPEGSEYPTEEKIIVKTTTLKDVIKDQVIDILKIDIEDGENELFNDPKFPELSKQIKLIIGEHLGGVNDLLLGLGYKAIKVEGNTIYER